VFTRSVIGIPEYADENQNALTGAGNGIYQGV
jgi:hypothetical protein